MTCDYENNPRSWSSDGWFWNYVTLNQPLGPLPWGSVCNPRGWTVGDHQVEQGKKRLETLLTDLGIDFTFGYLYEDSLKHEGWTWTTLFRGCFGEYRSFDLTLIRSTHIDLTETVTHCLTASTSIKMLLLSTM